MSHHWCPKVQPQMWRNQARFYHQISKSDAFSSTLLVPPWKTCFLNDAALLLMISNTKETSEFSSNMSHYLIAGGRGYGISSFLRLLPEHENKGPVSQHQNTECVIVSTSGLTAAAPEQWGTWAQKKLLSRLSVWEDQLGDYSAL